MNNIVWFYNHNDDEFDFYISEGVVICKHEDKMLVWVLNRLSTSVFEISNTDIISEYFNDGKSNGYYRWENGDCKLVDFNEEKTRIERIMNHKEYP
jgi:hypothetical protein